MKKFVITSLKACNIANLEEVKFRSTGRDVMITGQNGAGKSTVKKAIQWVLSGTTSDGEKLIPVNGGTPDAEVEIYDGEQYTRFRKRIVRTDGGNVTTNNYINGVPVKQKEIAQWFEKIVPLEVFRILFELGSFFNLNMEERRQMIMPKNPYEVGSSRAIKAKIREIKQLRQAIPEKIDELQHQFEEVDDRRSEVELEIQTLEEKLKGLVIDEDAYAESEKLKKEYFQLVKRQADVTERFNYLIKRREHLREQWRGSGKKCPLCGQVLSDKLTKEVRRAIKEKGAKINGDIQNLERELAELTPRLEELENRSQELSEVTKLSIVMMEREGIQSEINARKNYISRVTEQIARNDNRQRRIDSLIAKEKEYGRELTEREQELEEFELKIREELAAVTDEINSNFEHVNFQMFETLKTGEIRNICEATMNGVPYSNLSKGEKFKAALDVMNAFQRKYGVMLPCLIDDAESYTSNSLMKVGNQRIMFIVVDWQEKVEVTSF